MAQRAFVELIDDISGEKADETVGFALDGVAYEIDLEADTAAKLREALEPYVQAGRKARQGAGRRPSGSVPKRSDDSRLIRQWAQENGHKVSARGRIQADVRKAYQDAHA